MTQSILVPFQLLLISIVLCISYCHLSNNIEKYFSSLLKDEARRVKVVFVVFLVSFTSRAVVYAVTHFFYKEYDNEE